MIGTEINGQYRVIELIGEGGMGVVYMALDLELERRVALKFLKAELAGDSALIQRFRDELKTLAGFNHPNITTLFTSVTWQGHPVMVMELVEGETLQKMVGRRGPIPAEVCVPLINQALAGVGSAHRKKIVHRDLKPANLMLNLDGVVKVMDFGIAKIQNVPGLTRTNTAIGTILYMAPEQIRGAADARSDIYSMGVTLYELLAGRVPFMGDSQYDIEHAHIQQVPEPPTVHYPHIPQTLVEAVMRALAKDPASRFQTAEEFAAALGDGRQVPVRPVPVSTPTPIHPPPPPSATPLAEPIPESVPERDVMRESRAVRPDRSKLVAGALFAAAILVLIVAGFWVHSFLNPAPPIDANKTPAGTTGGSGDNPQKRTSSSDGSGVSPTEITPPSKKLVPPPIGGPTVVPPPRTKPAPTPGNGLAGTWIGSYKGCDDKLSARVTVILTEPAPGHVAGSLSFTTPQGAGGRCLLHGVFVEAASSLQLNASDCRGPTPGYLSNKYRSVLTYSGTELSGNVEPQDPCMDVNLTKK
jgi:serine/threonine-protein kinase